jgi:LacI family transcriptional regulator
MRKRPTARQVAERAGVSRTTVSFILNSVPGMRISAETRRRVLAAAHELGYHPDATARRMAAGQTRVLGFAVRQSPDQAFADRFLPQVLTGMGQAAAAQGYKVLFQPFAPDQAAQSYAQLLRERHADGLVLSGPRVDDQELAALQLEDARIVLLGQLPGSRLPYVDVDNVGGAAQATQHLIELGHRRIALVTNAAPVYTASGDRHAGYRRALEGAGLAYDETLVRYGDFTPQSGRAALQELLACRPRPTAVFVASDTVALGALQAIRQHSLRVPEDIAVVGFDDIQMAEYLDPPLTTVRLPAFGLGWSAAELLIRLITEAADVRSPHVILDTQLVVRASSGPPALSGALS